MGRRVKHGMIIEVRRPICLMEVGLQLRPRAGRAQAILPGVAYKWPEGYSATNKEEFIRRNMP